MKNLIAFCIIISCNLSGVCQKYITIYDTLYREMYCLEFLEKDTLIDSIYYFKLESGRYFICINDSCTPIPLPDYSPIINPPLGNFWYNAFAIWVTHHELEDLKIDSIPDGKYFEITKSKNQIKIIGQKTIKNNLEVDVSKSFYESGKLKEIYYLKNGKVDGFRFRFNSTGQVINKIYYINGVPQYLISLYSSNKIKYLFIDDDVDYYWSQEGELKEVRYFGNNNSTNCNVKIIKDSSDKIIKIQLIKNNDIKYEISIE